MPLRPRNLAKPRINSIRERIAKAAFTDGGSTSGTYQMQGEIPIGAQVLFSRVRVPVAWSGDTTAVLTIGDGSDVDRYNTGTPSILNAADAAGVAMGEPSGVRMHVAAVRPTLTVTGGADFTNIQAAALLDVEIVFVEAQS